MRKLCPDCGSTHEVGGAHRFVSNRPKPVSNAVSNKPVEITLSIPEIPYSGRLAKWRSKNRAKYNAYMRNYMKKRRTKC